MSRISYIENKKQNLSRPCYSENSWIFACYFDKNQVKNPLFLEITSSRWQEENNRLLFSITAIDDQGPNCFKNVVAFWMQFVAACSVFKHLSRA